MHSEEGYQGEPGNSPTVSPSQEDEFCPIPQVILNKRHRAWNKVLMHWEGLSLVEASWKDASTMSEQVPSFVFADKHNLREGSDVVITDATRCPANNIVHRNFKDN